MKILIRFFTLLLLIVAFVKHAGAQTQPPFIQILDTTQVSFTAAERVKFEALDQDELVIAKWIVQLNPFPNYLSGVTLTITHPETQDTLEFTADQVTSNTDGHFYWYGANLSGNTFQFGKYASGFLGNLHLADSRQTYTLLSLSETCTAMVKYSAGLHDCDDDGGPWVGVAQAFPNPVSDLLSVGVTKVTRSVEVFSSAGNLMQRVVPQSDGVVTFYTSDWPTDIYLVKVKHDCGVKIAKIIKP